MKRVYINIMKYFAPIVLLLLFACDSTEPLKDNFTLSDSYRLLWDDLPSIGGELKLGGFVGLFYEGGRYFYTVTTRGPVLTESDNGTNKTYFLVPKFVPEIVKLELQDDKTIKVVEEIEIKNPLGEKCTGAPTPNAWPLDEKIVNPSQVGDDWGVYPSGIFYDLDANLFYVSEEYLPSVLQITTRGDWHMRVSPGEGLRKAYANQTFQGGIAGVDVLPNGNFLFLLARSLEHNRNINDPNQTRAINYALRRIGLYDADSRSDLSMFYFVEGKERDGIDERYVKLGDIEFVNDTTFLVTEFANWNGLNRSLLFEVIVTDSTSKVKEGLEGINGKTFETLTDEEWQEAGLHPLKKVLLVDLKKFGFKSPEGIEIIDEKHVAVIENNNFGIVEANPENRSYSLDKSPIILKVVTLPIKLELK